MKMSQKLMLSLVACIAISNVTAPKSDKMTKKIAPISSNNYEKEISSNLSNYLIDIEAANGDQSKINKAMDRYDSKLSKIDQRYPDRAKTEAQEHAAKMAAERAKWHNYDVAYKALKDEFSKELAPYWEAQQALEHASFNNATRKDINLRKKASAIYESAIQGLQFQYRDELTKFNAEQQALESKYDF